MTEDAPVNSVALVSRLSRLAQVTAELTRARDRDSVTEIVVAHAAEAVGAAVASLALLTDPTTLTLVGISGAKPGAEKEWATFPLSAELPASEAVRTGQPIVVSNLAELERRYPALAGQTPEERSVVCLPLAIGARKLGSIGLAFSGPRNLDAQELQFLTTLADACAQSLDRVTAQFNAEDALAKLQFLAEASTELASSLDYRTTLTNVAQLAVPTLADWCSVEILEDGRLYTLAVAHTEPEKVELARELQQRYPPDPNSPTGPHNVVRTGKTEIYPHVTDEMLVAGARDDTHLQILRDLKLTAALMVPLATHGRTFGVITLISSDFRRTYSDSDVALAEDLARRAATAIDNAQLHSETKAAAISLQRAALPQSMPEIEGWELAAHYAPSGRTEIGGDFYDAVQLDDGRLVLVVGDVMGHGVKAAAAMAQMRAAIRAYVAIDPDPVAVLDNLDRMFAKYEMSQFVTLVYLVVNPQDNTLTVINAGHLPPLLLTPGGGAELMSIPVSVPLGIGLNQRETSVAKFPAGCTLLAYTDGLVERRGELLEVSLDRLVGAAAATPQGDLPTLMNDLIEAMRDEDHQDDITILAAHLLS
ncbi:MAG: SpoIIE family protein phosphatase [Candidatus Nanopelagicales bacterium]